MARSWTSSGTRPWLVLLAVVAAVILPVAWYLGSPLFIDRMVDERSPSGTAAAKGQPAPSRSGEFGTVDAIHKGEGTATLLTLPDGLKVLRFEGFRVTNGPDLYVYLSGHRAPRDSRQLHEGAAFEVGQLKGNVGNQNYELPADLDLAPFKSVVIYCRRFSVVFSTAELAATTS